MSRKNKRIQIIYNGGVDKMPSIKLNIRNGSEFLRQIYGVN